MGQISLRVLYPSPISPWLPTSFEWEGTRLVQTVQSWFSVYHDVNTVGYIRFWQCSRGLIQTYFLKKDKYAFNNT